MGGLAGFVGEGRVEAEYLLLGVAARRGQQADARVGTARPPQLEHVAIQRGVRGLHGEAAAAHGEDPTGVAQAASALASSGAPR